MTEQYAEYKSVRQAELAKQKEMQREIDWLIKKIDLTCEKLIQTHEHLVNSQEEYTVMQEERDWVQKELGSMQVQFTKNCSMLGAQKQDKLIEKKRAQHVKLLDKLQTVNKKMLVWENN